MRALPVGSRLNELQANRVRYNSPQPDNSCGGAAPRRPFQAVTTARKGRPRIVSRQQHPSRQYVGRLLLAVRLGRKSARPGRSSIPAGCLTSMTSRGWFSGNRVVPDTIPRPLRCPAGSASTGTRSRSCWSVLMRGIGGQVVLLLGIVLQVEQFLGRAAADPASECTSSVRCGTPSLLAIFRRACRERMLVVPLVCPPGRGRVVR